MVEREIKNEVKAFREIKALVRALSFPILNLWIKPWLISSFYSLVKSAEGLTQRLCQIQDLRTIIIEI